MTLHDLGWNEHFAAAFRAYADDRAEPARVMVEHRGGYIIQTDREELPAELAGRFRHEAHTASDRPTVGDWVVTQIAMPSQQTKIHAVLPRLTVFSRQTAGNRSDEQVLAANIDVAFIVASLGREPNLRSIERYLTMAWESGAHPVVVLTKSDLCSDIPRQIRSVAQVAGTAPVHAVCSLTGDGMEALLSRLPPTKTGAVLGPSGVGKSTLINHWLGAIAEGTQPVRAADHKGRHTTTQRHLIPLPHGALIIDTPGLRELQLWDGESGIESTFDDINDLATQCRFTDCQHETEPGCAVQEALAEGRLDAGRFTSHQKLQRELRHFTNKHDKRAQAEEKRRMRATTRYLRPTNKKRR